MLKPPHGATTVKTDSRGRANAGRSRAAIVGLTNLIDYAIVEGSELRRPLFVFLLRLARLALLEEDGISFQPIDLMMGNDGN